MSRSDADILDDIATAITSIHSHLRPGPISVEIVMDAVPMRLLEIGEAVKGISSELTATEPDVQRSDIAGMRDFLAHHYFATSPEIIQLTIDKRCFASRPVWTPRDTGNPRALASSPAPAPAASAKTASKSSPSAAWAHEADGGYRACSAAR